MSPLDYFDLDETADERTIKRAYAQRLRGVRPDEDPVGFQKLNEAYREALAYLMWRKRAADDDLDDVSISVDARADAAQPAPDPPRTRPAPPEDAVLDGANDRRAQARPFVLDLDKFFSDLREEAEIRDADALRHWLVGTTLEWPIDAKGIAAHHLLDNFGEDEPDLAPEQFEVIAEFFNLDDVLLGIDPLALGRLRDRVRDRRMGQQRHATMQRLLAPQHRRELADYMAWTGRGSWNSVMTRLCGRFLTSPYAYTWAMALRPIPSVTRNVLGFLRSLDEGRFDALAPAIDPSTIAFWEWAEARRGANRNVRLAICVVVFGLGLLDFIKLAGVPRPVPPSTELGRLNKTISDRVRVAEAQFLAASALEAKGDEASGVNVYEKLIIDTQWQSSPRLRQIVAMAMYNRANRLKNLKRLDEAEKQYSILARTFAFHYKDEADVQIWVARGLFNQGNLWFDNGDKTRAAEHFARVFGLYGERDDIPLQAQVAKSLFNLGIVHRDNGDRERARAVFQDVQKRFGAMTFEGKSVAPNEEFQNLRTLDGSSERRVEGAAVMASRAFLKRKQGCGGPSEGGSSEIRSLRWNS